jgi:cytochrome P450
MVIDIISLHRNPKSWNSPDVFNPSRFLPGGEAEKKARSGAAFAAFGGGSRHCIGRKFTMNEQKVFLSMFCKFNHVNEIRRALI